MSKIFLVDLEAVDTRYTGEWKTHVPELLKENGLDVVVIDGPTDIPAATTPGAFLNFGGTNIYKAVQVEKISRMFCAGDVKDGDYFLFTDAWHPGIINLKYMASLLNIKIKIGALWHAGSYDPADFLGRLIGDAHWVRHTEKAFYWAIDNNYFATDFHKRMFAKNLLNYEVLPTDYGVMYLSGSDFASYETATTRTGWPMEYMVETLNPYQNLEKRNMILFPHRIAPEKQVEIFRDLAIHLPQYEFVVCQDKQLTKQEYHKLLGQAKMVFSASLQETLGIGCYEGAILNAIPLVPDRLSYTEMYFNDFKYPSEWTTSYENYESHRSELCQKITSLMDSHSEYSLLLKKQTTKLIEGFFSANELIETIKKELNNNVTQR
jgi:glycosyltransferase involved in cell wall biosynthesis